MKNFDLKKYISEGKINENPSHGNENKLKEGLDVYEEEYDKGYDAGYKEGYKEGYKKGYIDGSLSNKSKLEENLDDYDDASDLEAALEDYIEEHRGNETLLEDLSAAFLGLHNLINRNYL